MDYPSDPSVGLVNGKFTDGDPAGGVPASLDRSTEMNAVFDELLALISGSGQVEDEATLNQVLKAVKRFSGGNVTTITADATLTLDQAGLVLVDATAGNVTLTLPTAADLAALAYTFVRIDVSANTVTVAAAATEAVAGAASIALETVVPRTVKSDGVNEFHLEADTPFATDTEAQAATATNRALTPANLLAAVFGIGQTWQDVTASRAAGVTYYNTTGKAIQVHVFAQTGGSGSNIRLTINGIVLLAQTQNATTTGMFGTWIIPPGASYILSFSSGGTLVNWFEMR